MARIEVPPGGYTNINYNVLTQEVLEELDYAPCRAAFTITTGRSGTEWLTHVLNHFEGIKALHEPYPAVFGLNRLRAEGKLTAKESWIAVREVRSHFVRNCYHHGITYVETSPFMSHLVADLMRSFRNAKFIHLHRNPRDFVLSAIPRGWFDGPNSQSHWFPKSYPDGLSQAERLMWWWNQVHTIGLMTEKHNKGICYRIGAEDMWSKSEPLMGLLEFLETPELERVRADGFITNAQEKPRNVAQQERIEWNDDWNAFLYDTCGKVMGVLGYK